MSRKKKIVLSVCAVFLCIAFLISLGFFFPSLDTVPVVGPFFDYSKAVLIFPVIVLYKIFYNRYSDFEDYQTDFKMLSDIIQPVLEKLPDGMQYHIDFESEYIQFFCYTDNIPEGVSKNIVIEYVDNTLLDAYRRVYQYVQLYDEVGIIGDNKKIRFINKEYDEINYTFNGKKPHVEKDMYHDHYNIKRLAKSWYLILRF